MKTRQLTLVLIVDQAKARFNAQQSAQKSNESLGNAMPGQGQMTSSGQGHPGAPVGLGGIGLGANPTQMAAARVGKPGSVNYSQSSPSPQSQVHSPAPGQTHVPPPTNGSSAIAYATPTANGGPASNGA
jgi:hypothetical protein